MSRENLVLLQQKVGRLKSEGKYKETIEKSYELLENGIQLNDYKSVLTAHHHLAASFYCIGDTEAAFHSITAHEKVCNENGDETDKLNSYNLLFLLYDYNKNYDMALSTLEKCIALGKKLKKYNIVSNGYSNYSHVCMIQGDYDKALEMANIGLQMAKRSDPFNPMLVIRVKLNISKALIGLSNFKDSKGIIDELFNNALLDSYIREKSQCLDLQGHWYSNQKRYREAFESFTDAKDLAQENNDVYFLKDIQEERCKLCELMAEFNLGYQVQKEYISLLKEISNRELELTALKFEIKRSITYLEKRANTDYLTGISNRNFLEETANDWLKKAYKTNESLACIAFDIDRLKSINDQYGHLFGDEVIRQVTKVCSKTMRKSDVIGRYGGDEFVVILKDTSLIEGEKRAEQILETVSDLKIMKDGRNISISISIGVTTNLECSAHNFDELFNAADIRLYMAKQNGRNQICIV